MKIILEKPSVNCGRKGLTLLEVSIVIFVIALLAGLIIPALMAGKQMERQIKCASALKQVGLAFRIWEGDNEDHYPMSVLTNSAGTPLYMDSTTMFRYFQVMSNELKDPGNLVCPADKRKPAKNFTSDFNSSCISYFVNLDADEKYPQTFLAGDRNLTANGIPIPLGLAVLTTNISIGWTTKIHRDSGNICLSDGSVQEYFGAALNTGWQQSGLVTNRLLMPDSAGK